MLKMKANSRLPPVPCGCPAGTVRQGWGPVQLGDGRWRSRTPRHTDLSSPAAACGRGIFLSVCEFQFGKYTTTTVCDSWVNWQSLTSLNFCGADVMSHNSMMLSPWVSIPIVLPNKRPVPPIVNPADPHLGPAVLQKTVAETLSHWQT